MKLDNLSLIFRFGIRQKVVLVLITVLLTALTVSSWFALQEEKKDVLAEINRRGADISRFTSTSLSFSVVGYDYHTVQLLLDEIVASEDVGYAKVLSAKGNVMAEAGGPVSPDGNNQRLVMFDEPISIDGNRVGQLVLGLSTESTLKRLESQKYSLVKREALIILLIAIGEFVALSLIIIRPVQVMTNSLSGSVDASGKIIGEIPIKTRDEFGLLAEQFNNLRNQLNLANDALQSKIESADMKLIESNQQLENQSRALKIVNEEFKRLAMTDPLTGLYNRRHFSDLMENEISLSRRHGDVNSFLLLDIDYFKKVNDTYGHLEGDMVLESFADILKSHSRETDILCRMGGEEFVVFCRRASKADSLIIAEKIRNAVGKRLFKFAGEEFHISVSIGIATFPHKEVSSISDLVKQADVALYYCKQNGRDQVAHFDELSGQSGGTVATLPNQ